MQQPATQPAALTLPEGANSGMLLSWAGKQAWAATRRCIDGHPWPSWSAFWRDAHCPAAKHHISIECTDVIATAMKPSDAPAESNWSGPSNRRPDL